MISRVWLPSGLSIVLSVVPECTASNGVYDNEENKEYNVDNGNLLPITLQIVQHSGFARLAIEAQNARLIIPQRTVRVGVCSRVRRGPISRSDIGETTIIWWLTATRLQINKYQSETDCSLMTTRTATSEKGQNFIKAFSSMNRWFISMNTDIKPLERINMGRSFLGGLIGKAVLHSAKLEPVSKILKSRARNPEQQFRVHRNSTKDYIQTWIRTREKFKSSLNFTPILNFSISKRLLPFRENLTSKR